MIGVLVIIFIDLPTNTKNIGLVVIAIVFALISLVSSRKKKRNFVMIIVAIDHEDFSVSIAAFINKKTSKELSSARVNKIKEHLVGCFDIANEKKLRGDQLNSEVIKTYNFLNDDTKIIDVSISVIE